jgi:hypothetical protein
MIPLRARYLLLLICTALTAAAVLEFIRDVPTPNIPAIIGTSAPKSLTPLSLLTSPEAVSVDIPLSHHPAVSVVVTYDESTLAEDIKESDIDFFWMNVETLFALSVREKFSRVQLSESDTRVLTQNIRDIRESLIALRQINRSAESGREIIGLKSQLDENIRNAQALTGISMSELLSRLTTEGIDNDKPEKGEVVLEYLQPPDR